MENECKNFCKKWLKDIKYSNYQCFGCKKKLCSECKIPCIDKECGLNYCNKCYDKKMLECYECKKEYCEIDFKNCESCEKIFCKNCSDDLTFYECYDCDINICFMCYNDGVCKNHFLNQ